MSKIGIDLGTTNSLVASWSENGPYIIPNSFGDNLTPSIVSVDEKGEIFVGKIAKERLITHPSKTAAAFKRMMGTQKIYHMGQYNFTPVELSSFVLRSLKEDAEVYLNEPVIEAVISVPAYFNDTQRKATKRAAELAGLKVERLVNEPTAAAISYGFNRPDEESNILIFDLGGGTFDVSILEFFDGIMQVRAISGDNYLGGEDFTHALMDYFKEVKWLDNSAIRGKYLSQLYKQAEVCKCKLSSDGFGSMQICIDDKNYSEEIDAVKFEEISSQLLQRLRMPVERAMRDAGFSIVDLDAVILIGGSTRIPSVKSMISKMTGKMPFSNIDPDEAVALGAAVQMALKEKNKALCEMILTDVCPYTLGIEISRSVDEFKNEAGYYSPIIERNMPIPTSKTDIYSTVSDNQTKINLKIYQGESRRVENNIKLGEITIPIPAAPKGKTPVNVRFTYDINGILEVEATVLSTGLKKRLIIQNSFTEISPEKIEERFKELSGIKIHPRDKAENRLLLERGERLYEENLGQNRYEIDASVREFENALASQNDEKVKAAAESLKKLLDFFEGREKF